MEGVVRPGEPRTKATPVAAATESSDRVEATKPTRNPTATSPSPHLGKRSEAVGRLTRQPSEAGGSPSPDHNHPVTPPGSPAMPRASDTGAGATGQPAATGSMCPMSTATPWSWASFEVVPQ